MLVELKRMESEEPIQGEVILPYSHVWSRIMNVLRDYHPIAHNGA
jgi:hypothetical protein